MTVELLFYLTLTNNKEIFMIFQKKYFEATKTEARRKIVLELDRPKTPQELAKELNYDKLPAVSKLLIDLTKIGVTVCLTPKRRRDRQTTSEDTRYGH